MLIGLAAVSCSEDQPKDIDKTENSDSQYLEELRTNCILASLCDIDTLNNGSVNYTPRIGKAVYEQTPTVYYTIANTVDEAEDTYRSIIAALNNDSTQTFMQREVRQGDIHLTFTEGNTTGETARIVIDCQRLKNVLTEIVFIPEDLWPQNDNSSPFRFLGLYRYNQSYYICVRDCRSGQGILLTFDEGYEIDEFKKYAHWQGRFYLYRKTASYEALNALARAMNNNSSRFPGMMDRLRMQDDYKVGRRGYELDLLWCNSSATYDNSYSYDHGLWKFYNCYYVNICRTSFKSKEGIKEAVQYSDYYEHDQTPQTTNPSHEVRFDYDFDKSGWTEIYKGI